MRFVLLLLAGGLAAAPLHADDPYPSPFGTDDVPTTVPESPGDPIKRFDGRMTLTTADFTVPDGWELRWHSDQVLSIGVIRLDSTVVAGTSGRTVGSLYVPQGGSYRLRVKTSDPVAWDISIYAIKTAPPDPLSYMPTVGPAFKPVADTAPPQPAAPPAAPAPKPAPPVAAPLPTALTPQQKQSIVLIKGDRSQGTGFFMKHGTDTVLMTTQHLIADNPNWHAIAANGAPVEVTKIQGAADRDLVMLSVKDFGYAALPEGDPTKLKPGDQLLASGANGLPVPPMAVGSIDDQRILIDALRPPQGSPLLLAATGQVVGLVANGPRVTRAQNFTPDNFTARDIAVERSIAPYGERIDDVSSWETCQAVQLQAEAEFISAFRQHSREIDAYLNGNGEPRNRSLWNDDDKLKAANAKFRDETPDGNAGQRTQALHALLFQLTILCDADMDEMQRPSNFYSYQRSVAQSEVAYRAALKAEVDGFTSDTTRFDPIVRRNNTDDVP